MAANPIRLANNLFVYRGAVNVGIVRDGPRALLIDCGPGDVDPILQRLGIRSVAAVFFTHYHRDHASGVERYAGTGARVAVPAAERMWFEDVERFWNDPAYRWHRYDLHPQPLMLARSVPIHNAFKEGDSLRWGSARISVLETPGHTEGSVSYVIEVERNQRFIFSGDLLHSPGRIWELYSLQKGVDTRDYHGFLGNIGPLFASLEKLRSSKPTALIPTHGEIMPKPDEALDALRRNLTVCHTAYAATASVRYYFPALLEHFGEREDFLPFQASSATPNFVEHIGTSWVVRSANGEAFVLDCGSPDVIQTLRQQQNRGRLGKVAWLWITHYHDDHVDAIPQFKQTFGCPIVTDGSVAAVVERPTAWQLPCLSPAVIKVDHRTKHGESWRWREFTLTAYHLPGQSLYHAGLLVEGRGARLFFVGDSFTPGGLDDYCAHNRNLLGKGRGFDACLDLLLQIKPDAMLNSHVDRAFTFTEAACWAMRANLALREKLYGKTLPWQHPNFGLDPSWMRCDPYEQPIRPGNEGRIDIVITNHATEPVVASCRPQFPASWAIQAQWQQTSVQTGAEGRIAFRFRIPTNTPPGRWVVPVEVTYGDIYLGQLGEALIVT